MAIQHVCACMVLSYSKRRCLWASQGGRTWWQQSHSCWWNRARTWGITVSFVVARIAVQWRGMAVTRWCSVVPSCCIGVPDQVIISGSNSGPPWRRLGPTSFPPSFLLPSSRSRHGWLALPLVVTMDGSVARALTWGFYSLSTSMVSGEWWRIGNGHV